MGMEPALPVRDALVTPTTLTGERKMAAKHTPGPWASVGERNCFIRDKYNGPVATIQPRAETEANAHLIAAAPELLAALQLVLKHYQEVDGDVIAPQVRAAIAKAKGLK